MNEDIAADIRRVESELEASVTAHLKMEALKRLEDNPDFALLIQEGYLTEHKDRNVALLGSGQFTEDTRKEVIREIDAVSRLDYFFGKIVSDGHIAETNIEQCKEEISELHSVGGESNE